MRFFGIVGYADENVETAPGVWEDRIIEQHYQGDVIRNTSKLDYNGDLNPDISVGNSISIVADEFAVEHFSNIRYVEWAGGLWTISTVEVKPPRLILSLGSVYNGPTARTTNPT